MVTSDWSEDTFYPDPSLKNVDDDSEAMLVSSCHVQVEVMPGNHL